MKALRILAFALVVFSSTALAAPDDAPPRVELPLGPYVRPGRPLDVRVIGGADRVRAPGTPWALPQGERGDEFILQMPAAVGTPLDLTVQRERASASVLVSVTVLPGEGVVVALFGDASAPAGATGVHLGLSGLPTVSAAWLLVDDVIGDRGGLPHSVEVHVGHAAERGTFHEPLTAPADPRAFAATAEVAAQTPRLSEGIAIVLLVLAATETLLVVILRSRRDRSWSCAVWLSAPAIVAGAFIVKTMPLGVALRAVPFAVEDENSYERVVFVRIEALRDGEGTLLLPVTGDAPAAAVRFSSDDRTVEDMSLGTEVRVSLKAGEIRVVAYQYGHGVGLHLLPRGATEPGPVVSRWLRGFGIVPRPAVAAGFASGWLPDGRGIDVLPGLEMFVEAPPPAK